MPLNFTSQQPRPSLTPKAVILRLLALTLFVLCSAYCVVWGYRFYQIYTMGEDLIAERLIILSLLMIQLIGDATKIEFRIQRLTWLLPWVAFSLAGFASEKLSLIAGSFAMFLVSAALCLTYPIERRKLVQAFAVAFILVVPGKYVTPPDPYTLQHLAAGAAATISPLLAPGSVWRDTFTIDVAGSAIHIASACDGGTFFRLSIALAALASLSQGTWLTLTLRIAFAAVAAVLLNWCRLLFIIWLTHIGYWEAALVTWHAFIGHITFVIGITPIIWFSDLPDRWNHYIDRILRIKR